jgi:ribonucleoside-diphosphate reductase alpha chain
VNRGIDLTDGLDLTATQVPKKHLQPVGDRKSRSHKPLGLTIQRHFTRAGEDPFDAVEWELRDASIGDEQGNVVFEQKDVEIPKSWSQLATNVVVSKYFRGHINTSQRESSVKQLISRVVGKIREWGDKSGYFSLVQPRDRGRLAAGKRLFHQLRR